MPRVRKGPSGPKKSAGGAKGTNRSTSHKNAGVSGPPKSNMTPPPGGNYSGKGY